MVSHSLLSVFTFLMLTHTCGWRRLASVAPRQNCALGQRSQQQNRRALKAMVRKDGRFDPSLRPSLWLPNGHELDDEFTGLACDQGLMTVAGFGSLLSVTSARTTFPQLSNFRVAKVPGWRRVFAHTCDIFYARGIARPETMEVSSLSVEEAPGSEIIVTLFEVEANTTSIQAFIEREHEFRFVAVEPHHLDGMPTGRPAVMCARWDDESYKARRCPPEEWARRYGRHGVARIWRDDVLPCRAYLRHCVLAASKLGEPAAANFLDATLLADRQTTVREHLERDPGIMEELPPPELVGRYSG